MAESWEPTAESWEPREASRPPEPSEEEPRRSRERAAPARAARAPEPNGRVAEPNGRAPEPNGRVPRSREPRSRDAPEPMSGRGAISSLADSAPPEPALEPATEQMPRVVRGTPVPDPSLTTPMQQQRRRAKPDPEAAEPDFDDDAGPSTMVGGAPAGAEAWHRARTDGRRRPPGPDGPEPGFDDDGASATMVGGAPAGAEAWHRSRTDERRRDVDGGPATQAGAPMNFDDDDDPQAPARDYPAGLGGRSIADEEATGFFGPEDERDEPEKADSDEPGTAPAWPAVIAQWIAGAIGGAALWVGFRFLWRDFSVVALAAAVLATVGLVVLVRALLRSNDLRTTLFAVLVGLLLTVSPAILVLLGR